ncbi:MAG: hypothetical protein GFH25_541324n32 [Chloroflexi bacterium AL-N10]|nr:hypothetical protein [Chloroflexi bacterium AL-N10]
MTKPPEAIWSDNPHAIDPFYTAPPLDTDKVSSSQMKRVGDRGDVQTYRQKATYGYNLYMDGLVKHHHRAVVGATS